MRNSGVAYPAPYADVGKVDAWPALHSLLSHSSVIRHNLHAAASGQTAIKNHMVGIKHKKANTFKLAKASTLSFNL